MRLLGLLFLPAATAVTFCANKYLPSGSCPENAAEICEQNQNYCVKTYGNVALQYSVDGVAGCDQFQTGGHSGEECFGVHVEDNPNDAPACSPVNRNYCECVECTSEADCTTIAGLGAGCAGQPAGSGDIYAAGFVAGKNCGIDQCADALKASYQELGQCGSQEG
jgi:hypothetical protein